MDMGFKLKLVHWNNFLTLQRVDRTTRKIIGYRIGSRSKKTLKTMLKIFPIKAKKYCTDDYAAYKNIIPSKNHTIGKAHTFTVESKNSQLTHYLKSLK